MDSSALDRLGQLGNLQDVGGTLARQLMEIGIDGRGPWRGASVIAQQQRERAAGDDDALGRLVSAHVRLAAAGGFTSGLGGLVTAVLALPAKAAGFQIIAMRMVAGIAYLRGYDVQRPEVRTAALVCLLGAAGADIVRDVARRAPMPGSPGGPHQFVASSLTGLSPATRMQLERALGMRLLTAVGAKGGLRLRSRLPIVGAPIAAGQDASACRAVARYAEDAFPDRS